MLQQTHLLATSVAVHLSVQHQDVDILTSGQHVVQATEADIVCPAITTLQASTDV